VKTVLVLQCICWWTKRVSGSGMV